MPDIHTQIMFSLRTPPLYVWECVCKFKVRYHGWRPCPGRQQEIIPLIHTLLQKITTFSPMAIKFGFFYKILSQDTLGAMCVFMMCITSYFSSLNIRFLKWFLCNWIRVASHNWLNNTSTEFSAQMLSKKKKKNTWPTRWTSYCTEDALVYRTWTYD